LGVVPVKLLAFEPGQYLFRSRRSPIFLAVAVVKVYAVLAVAALPAAIAYSVSALASCPSS
jgi:hypothetical protein